ncbi:MAG: hypothetical protein ABW168_00330 [Sedimenticola sp.]
MAAQSKNVQEMPLRARAVYLDPRIHARIKKAASNNCYPSIQAAAEEAVSTWLDKKEKELNQ